MRPDIAALGFDAAVGSAGANCEKSEVFVGPARRSPGRRPSMPDNCPPDAGFGSDATGLRPCPASSRPLRRPGLRGLIAAAGSICRARAACFSVAAPGLCRKLAPHLTLPKPRFGDKSGSQRKPVIKSQNRLDAPPTTMSTHDSGRRPKRCRQFAVCCARRRAPRSSSPRRFPKGSGNRLRRVSSRRTSPGVLLA